MVHLAGCMNNIPCDAKRKKHAHRVHVHMRTKNRQATFHFQLNDCLGNAASCLTVILVCTVPCYAQHTSLPSVSVVPHHIRLEFNKQLSQYPSTPSKAW